MIETNPRAGARAPKFVFLVGFSTKLLYDRNQPPRGRARPQISVFGRLFLLEPNNLAWGIGLKGLGSLAHRFSPPIDVLLVPFGFPSDSSQIPLGSPSDSLQISFGFPWIPF